MLEVLRYTGIFFWSSGNHSDIYERDKKRTKKEALPPKICPFEVFKLTPIVKRKILLNEIFGSIKITKLMLLWSFFPPWRYIEHFQDQGRARSDPRTGYYLILGPGPSLETWPQYLISGPKILWSAPYTGTCAWTQKLQWIWTQKLLEKSI